MDALDWNININQDEYDFYAKLIEGSLQSPPTVLFCRLAENLHKYYVDHIEDFN